MTKNNRLDPFDAVTETTLRAAIKLLPKKEHEQLLSLALGVGFESGDFTIPDGADIPPHLRAANLERIKQIPDVSVREEMLAGH